MRTVRPLLLLICSCVVHAELASQATLVGIHSLANNNNNGNDNDNDDAVTSAGNGVVMTADGSRLIVTTATGRLHIVEAAALRTADDNFVFYEPEISNDSPISCQSAAVVVSDENDDGAYAIYVVTDTDTSTSRVLAVELETARLRWSVTVPGVAVGTPYYSRDKVYVVHNTAAEGRVSVLGLDGTTAVLQTTVTAPDSVVAPGPLGPPTALTTWDSTSDPDGSVTTVRDVLVLAEKRDDVLSADGALYFFVATTVELQEPSVEPDVSQEEESQPAPVHNKSFLTLPDTFALRHLYFGPAAFFTEDQSARVRNKAF
jgi:hypothetical protein